MPPQDVKSLWKRLTLAINYHIDTSKHVNDFKCSVDGSLSQGIKFQSSVFHKH